MNWFKKMYLKATGNLPILNIVWRKFLIPIMIALVVGVLTKVLFGLLPENMLLNDFSAGWISCVLYYSSQSYIVRFNLK